MFKKMLIFSSCPYGFFFSFECPRMWPNVKYLQVFTPFNQIHTEYIHNEDVVYTHQGLCSWTDEKLWLKNVFWTSACVGRSINDVPHSLHNPCMCIKPWRFFFLFSVEVMLNDKVISDLRAGLDHDILEFASPHQPQSLLYSWVQK